jgi:hypothetical protein
LPAGALAYALCPFLLVGRPLPWSATWTVLPAGALSVVAVAAALVWITHMDIPLEASQ